MLKKLLKNSFFLLLANVFMRGVIFTVNIIAVKVLPQYEYGQFSLLRNTATLIEGTISGAIGAVSIKKIAEDQQSPPIHQLLLINLLSIIITSTLVLFMASWISDKIKFPGSEILLLSCLIPLIISIKAYSLSNNILIGLENYTTLFKGTIFAILVSSPIALYLLLQYDFFGAVLSVALIYFLDATFKFKYIYSFKFKENHLKDKFSFFEFFSSTGYLFSSMLISNIAFWFSRITLASENNGLNEIAIFDVSFQFLTMVMMLTGATTSVLLPILSKDKTNQKKHIFLNFGINYFITFAFSILVILFGEWLLKFLGETYATSNNFFILKLLMIVAFLFVSSSIMNKVFISLGRIKYVLFVTVCSVFTMLAFLLTNPQLSATSLVYGYMIYYGVSFFLYITVYNACVK
jgi:O-antigen/teichoic acid export membrane protein